MVQNQFAGPYASCVVVLRASTPCEYTVHIEGCCLGSHVGPGFNPEVMPYVRGGAGGGGSGMVRVYAMCIAKMSALDFKSLQ